MLARCNIKCYSFRFPLSNLLEFSDLKYSYEIFRTKTMECEKNEQFRPLILYELNRGSKAAEAARNICAFYGEDPIAERTTQKWFALFNQGNFDTSDTPGLGRLCCASGGIWGVLSIMNCLRRTRPSLLNAIVNNFAVWRKQSSKNARVDDMV
jgi:hypothetical protein